AYILATSADSIYDLVEAASAFGAGGILVITLVGLFTKRLSGLGAIFALIGGVVITPIAEYQSDFGAPFMLSIFGAGFCYILGTAVHNLLPATNERDSKAAARVSHSA